MNGKINLPETIAPFFAIYPTEGHYLFDGSFQLIPVLLEVYPFWLQRHVVPWSQWFEPYNTYKGLAAKLYYYLITNQKGIEAAQFVFISQSGCTKKYFFCDALICNFWNVNSLFLRSSTLFKCHRCFGCFRRLALLSAFTQINISESDSKIKE